MSDEVVRKRISNRASASANSGLARPGPSLLRNVEAVLRDKQVIVLPALWDAQYTITELNVRLRSSFLACSLVEHSSFAPEGIVGATARALLLRRLDPTRPIPEGGGK